MDPAGTFTTATKNAQWIYQLIEASRCDIQSGRLLKIGPSNDLLTGGNET